MTIPQRANLLRFCVRTSALVASFAMAVAAAVACSSEDDGKSSFDDALPSSGTVRDPSTPSPTGSDTDIGDIIGGDFNTDAAVAGNGSKGDCEADLTGIVRDFRRGDRAGGHPDFETFMGSGQKGIVLDALGADGKPVYALSGAGPFTSGKAAFDQWYRDVDGVNKAIRFRLVPDATVKDRFVYDSTAFFPIDNQGFGNEGLNHNFHFTFELHTQFTYSGGEVFTFRGDDDLWTFINGKRVIDLGGLHQVQSSTVRIDEVASTIGLVKGRTYPLDVFHAERHTTESNFRIETSIRFTNCLPIIR